MAHLRKRIVFSNDHFPPICTQQDGVTYVILIEIPTEIKTSQIAAGMVCSLQPMLYISQKMVKNAKCNILKQNHELFRFHGYR